MLLTIFKTKNNPANPHLGLQRVLRTFLIYFHDNNIFNVSTLRLPINVYTQCVQVTCTHNVHALHVHVTCTHNVHT